MISIRGPDASKAPLEANILPCRIKYTGPASSSRQFWNPTSEQAQEANDGTPGGETHTSYFRGRKLVGTKLVVPDGYQGRVLNPPSNEPLTGNQKREVLYQDDEDDEGDEIEEAAQWTTESSFSEIMVWGHELAVDGSQDGVVKGLEEWMGMSKILNGYDGT
ncbi:hypothetical protein H072_10496 [Dactylellina haptotyla CBS 200.50]|uniref:Uncharacterized protein n=1 Tax=Dactylellina haptotyla (strain CBS 200.50) TaxID=1284197 RepID=S8BAC9_DACHA|nr:hypothetical protein H072_10496 [Dactylellina haptotyla CBS 200.50]